MDKLRKGPAPARRPRKKPGALQLPELATALELPARPAQLPLRLDTGQAAEPRWCGIIPAGLPLAVSVINHGYLELGLAVLVVGRRLGRSILAGHFVVDLLARGVVESDGEVLACDELEGYLDVLDARMPLCSVSIEMASFLIREGVRIGAANGIDPAEGLEFWSRVLDPTLPGPADDEPARARLFGSAGRPMAIAEVLTRSGPPPEGGWHDDTRELRCVVRQPGLREH